MRKILAMLFVVALCLPVFAEDRHTINSVTYDATLTVQYSTPTAAPCDVAYILIQSTGAIDAKVITIRDNTTSKFVLNLAAATTTDKVVDLTKFPVRFATNLNYNMAVVDTAVTITLIYKKLN